MKPINLTIIMPTYNRAKLLRENIETILKSDYAFELLIIDDGSQDETKEVVELFGDRRITYRRHSSNCGQAKSLNEGIELAKNSQIMLCEDDAFIIDPDRFFEILLFELNQKNIVGTHLIRNGTEIEPKFIEKIKCFFAEPLSKEVYTYNEHKRKIVKFCNACFAFNKADVRTRFEERDYMRARDVYNVYNAFRIESDFQLQARKEGTQIIYNPKLVIDHKRYLTGGHRVHRKDSFLFQCMVNHMIFLKRFYSIWNVYAYAVLEFLAHPAKWSIVGKALEAYIKLTPKRVGMHKGKS